MVSECDDGWYLLGYVMGVEIDMVVSGWMKVELLVMMEVVIDWVNMMLVY